MYRTKTKKRERPRVIWTNGSNRSNRSAVTRNPKRTYADTLRQNKKRDQDDVKNRPWNNTKIRQRERLGKNLNNTRREGGMSKPIEYTNGDNKLLEIASQLQRLTKLLEGMVLGRRNL